MIRSMIAGISHATVVGVSGAIIGSLVWGTASVPFIVASSVGFALGSWRWYQTATKEALIQLQRYPRLIRHHMESNFPWQAEIQGRGMDFYTVKRFSSSWTLQSMLVATWLSAEPSLGDLRSRAESRIIEEYAEEDK
ncbi:hypothetical protein CMUS01_15014 [Colletotrichum musicola]|uniref:Uncharacterized protein n=1 Tax=Colletotrichum musicola TaxID=2175873 RepID=A0A8H6IZS1_9PEZI|nr:hypothetical protein CMUS01_15014 [Colletotrichum musicola]